MIELKIDKFEKGKVVFHIERQDEEDYDRLSDRLNDKPVAFKLSDGFNYYLESRGFIEFYPNTHTFYVRGTIRELDYTRIEVSIAEYLIIYELINKYNEKFS